jgi:hypothetical protein
MRNRLPDGAPQRFILLCLVGFAVIVGGGHVLALALGHPEHAELGVWKYVAVGLLCCFAALRYPFDLPGTRGAHVPRKARRVFRGAFAIGAVVFLGLAVRRDHTVAALYQRCRALYAAADTPRGRAAAGAEVLDPSLKEDAPSA